MYKGNIFSTDFTNLDTVIEIAKQLHLDNPAVCVYKVPSRRNYNIGFIGRIYELGAVIHWPKLN